MSNTVPNRLEPTLEHTYDEKTTYPNPRAPTPDTGTVSYEPITDYAPARPQDEDHAAAMNDAMAHALAQAAGANSPPPFVAINEHTEANAPEAIARRKAAEDELAKRLLDEPDTDAAVQD
jgi:hypothetical protein